MLYNGSSDHPLKGVILTSRMVKEREELMMIEAYTTSQTGDASIKVYLESTWGHQFHRLHIDGDLTQNQWTNLSVCLPKGTFRVMILATTSLAQFVAIDNVYLSSVSCSVSDPELPGQFSKEYIVSIIITIVLVVVVVDVIVIIVIGLASLSVLTCFNLLYLQLFYLDMLRE